MSDDIAAVILAGGAARRLGGIDKPLLPIAGRPILARIIATLALDIPAIAVSANGDPARLAAFARPVLPDRDFAGRGPLAGLLAGLDWAAGQGARLLLSVPGDTPFIPRGLARALDPAPAVAASGGRVHPLVGLWPVGCAAELRAFLGGALPPRAGDFALRIGARVVNFADNGYDLFHNINTPGDLDAARAMVERGA